MSIRDIIMKQIEETLLVTGGEMKADLKDDTQLLGSGLDSLGFAILVAKLEELFGEDPFTLMDEPYYPRTFGEFVAIYEKYFQ